MQRPRSRLRQTWDKRKDPRLARRQQLFHRKFGAGADTSAARHCRSGGSRTRCRCACCRADRQRGGVDFRNPGAQPAADGARDAVAGQQQGLRPAWRSRSHHGLSVSSAMLCPLCALIGRFRLRLALWRETRYGTPSAGPLDSRPPEFESTQGNHASKSSPSLRRAMSSRSTAVCVVPDGNQLPPRQRHDDAGGPRRISDGNKVSERWKTTEQVERAPMSTRTRIRFPWDGEGRTSWSRKAMNRSWSRPTWSATTRCFLKTGSAFLQVHNGVAIAIELPQRVTVEHETIGRQRPDRNLEL